MEMLSRCEENGINYYYFGVKVGEGHGSNQSLRANWSRPSYWLFVTAGNSTANDFPEWLLARALGFGTRP